MGNKDSGNLFRARANELLEYLQTQPTPYCGTDADLAKALYIGHRSIARYIHYLKGYGEIQVAMRSKKLDKGWLRRRKIVLSKSIPVVESPPETPKAELPIVEYSKPIQQDSEVWVGHKRISLTNQEA